MDIKACSVPLAPSKNAHRVKYVFVSSVKAIQYSLVKWPCQILFFLSVLPNNVYAMSAVIGGFFGIFCLFGVFFGRILFLFFINVEEKKQKIFLKH